MKKILALILATLMLALSVACAAPAAATVAEATEAPAAEATEAPAAEATEAPAADDDWSYIQSNGKLVIGITEYAPMNYYDESGKLIGFDTEFAEAACAKLGLTPEFVVIDWDTKELELSSKKIDCIWNGLTVTEERKANMDFTASYLKNQQVVVVLSSDAANYTDAASFVGKTVVAEAGSAGAAAIAANMADADFVEVQAQSDALLEVKTGKAAAAVIDLTMANAMTGEGTDYSDLTILPIEMPGEEYAIGFRVGSTATAQLNDIITAFGTDGTFATLAEKYELSDLLIK
ncbi:MAG: transporter substrate-binding domain-containing protein [Eubacteriales bacterium]|nr:transporter substrate-binding domain-containing protein [Eubacteriales bacterium]